MGSYQKDHDQNIIELTRVGLSATEIATRLHISPRTVIRRRGVLGVQVKPGRQPVPENKISQMKQLLDDGASYRETAATVGVHMKTVAKYFPGRGWTVEQSADLMSVIMRTHHALKKGKA